MHLKILLVFVVLCLVNIALAKKAKCSGPWVYGPCTPKRGNCGKGVKKATSSGERCKTISKKTRCMVPCLNSSDGALQCKYGKVEHSSCNPTTNTMTYTLSLKTGGGNCPRTKKFTKRCKKNGGKDCKYRKRSRWGQCIGGVKQMTLALKKGDPTTCLPTKIVTKNCKSGERKKLKWKKRGKKGGRKDQRKVKNACKYDKGNWGECDLTSNLQQRTMTLESGDPNRCIRTKMMTRKCKPVCKYDRGNWTECDAITKTKTRVDVIRSGSSQSCQSTKNVVKKCRIKCQYDFGTWTNCTTGGMRSRTSKLLTGHPSCAHTKTVNKPCMSKKGKGRCFYGQWGDFGPCENGVKTKRRSVISGGDHCQRKAARTRPCQSMRV